MQHSYDATGQLGLLSTTTDAGARVLTYAYDANNRLHSVSETAGTTTYAYDATNNETGITHPNGTTVTQGYDDASQLTSVLNQTSTGTPLSAFSYVLDTDSRRHTVTEADGSVVTDTYDWGSRLTSEVRTGTNAYTRTYVPDAVGNRTSETVGTATTTFTYDSDNRLKSTASTTGGFVNRYGYDKDGRQNNRKLAGQTYVPAYDYDGQLTSLSKGGVTLFSYQYDALGRRVSRTAGTTTTDFLLDGSAVLLEQQGGTTTATYTYGNALIRKDGETPLFDGLGSERTVTNSSQTVTGTATYEGFGQTVATTGSSSNPYEFAATSGYRNDGDVGLMLVGARYYDAQVSGFITRDTDLEQQPYLYCEHDPINFVDPSGHDGETQTNGSPPGTFIPGLPAGPPDIGAPDPDPPTHKKPPSPQPRFQGQLRRGPISRFPSVPARISMFHFPFLKISQELQSLSLSKKMFVWAVASLVAMW